MDESNLCVDESSTVPKKNIVFEIYIRLPDDFQNSVD